VTQQLAEIEASLPPPMKPTPVKSPRPTVSPKQDLEIKDVTDDCPKCELPVTGPKDVQCNFCDRWYHRKCLNPGFIEKDLPTAKKDFILIICAACTATVQLKSLPRTTTSSTGSQCGQEHLLPTAPLVDSTCQTDTTETDHDADIEEIVTETPSESNVNRAETSRRSKPADQYYIVQGIDDPLSNMYEFDFTYEGEKYRSLEHTFQAKRAQPHDADLSMKIKMAPDPFIAKRLGKQLKQPTDFDADLDLMRKLVEAKAPQCKAFRQAIRAARAKGQTFLHSTYPKDRFFASGLHHQAKSIPSILPGRNHLGKIIAEVAKSIGPESDYESSVAYEQYGGIAVILYDGESLPTSIRRRKRETHRSQDHRATIDTRRGVGNKDHRCYHCGVPGHIKANCRLIDVDVVCRWCKGHGHKQRYCPVYYEARVTSPVLTPEQAQHAHVAAPSLFSLPLHTNVGNQTYYQNFPPLPSPQTF
jgi:predicted NAD-dependent protein-ADP-ribosyltransferase YbiA (DUF1768 family)